ncbi:MAG: Ig-like domain-containing protein [Pirellulaceae bacterium]
MNKRSGSRRFRPGNALQAESLESRNLLAADVWQNATFPEDVNADGIVTPVDALMVINELNTIGARSLRSGLAPTVPDMYYDVNADEYITPIDALIILNELNAEGEGDALAQIRLQVVNADGDAVTAVDVGAAFELQVYVQDLTGREDGGVFAGYLDIEFPDNLVSVDGVIEYSTTYNNAKSGTIDVGLIDEVGAIDGLSPLGPDELLLVTIPFVADAAGTVDFAPNAADQLPLHDVLLYGVPDGEASSKVDQDRIMFIGASLDVGSGEQTAPVAVDDAYEIDEGQTLNVAAPGVLLNDSDPNGDSLTSNITTEPNNGTFSFNSDGSFSYTPAAGFVGTDSFTYRVSDGNEFSSDATVTITVNPLNSAPVAANDAFSISEDNVLTTTVSVLANDTDADGDNLTAAVVSTTTNGSLTLNPSGTFTYTPNANFNGTDSFTYRANDGTENSQTATVTITVMAVNDPPVGEADSYMTSTNTALTVNAADGVLANDSDVENATLSAELISNATNGTVALNANGSFTYTPATDFTGQDSFTYRATDGELDSATQTVTITVAGESLVNIRLEPANTDGVPISKIGPGGEFLLNVYVQDVSGRASDVSGVFAGFMDVTYASSLVSTNGSISYGSSYPNTQSGTMTAGMIDEVGASDGLNPLGNTELLLFSVPFVANNTGTVTFASDPAENLPAHDILLFGFNSPIDVAMVTYGTASLEIATSNAPAAGNDEYITDEDTPLIVSAASGVLGNDSDPDGDSLAAVLVNQPTNGTVSLNSNGGFTYTPAANFFGTDAFTYRATDGSASSDVATVTITVNAVDDAAVVNHDTYTLQDPGRSLTVTAANGVLANDVDVEGNAMTAVLVGNPSKGTVTLNEDGSFVYSPNSDTSGQDSFTYRVTSNGVQSAVATVTINVGDLSPSSVSGFVYSDANNNGVRESHELNYGGVVVTLTGTNLLGESVNMTTRTDANGAYRFGELLRGEYTITESQPLYIIDGLDTVNGQASLRNDRHIVNLGSGVSASGYNFGERGLMPQFIMNPMFFASQNNHGLMMAMFPNGELSWFCTDLGWDGYESFSLAMASNGATGTITAVTDSGATSVSSVRMTGTSSVRMMGDMVNGMLIRFVGDAEDFGLGGGEGEPDTNDVDDAFADGGF